jgi:hypothetical protein
VLVDEVRWWFAGPAAPRATERPQAARFLDACVGAGLNVLVAGGTQAGKTTLTVVERADADLRQAT